MSQKWIQDIFKADQVNQSNIVRRSVFDVNKYASHKDLIAEVKRRGYHMVQVGTQYIILCDPNGSISPIC